MKQSTSYRFLTIANKLRCELRIVIDTERSPEYTSSGSGSKVTSLTFHPIIMLTMVKPQATDENGQRIQTPWNPNDSISMTKFNLPIFIDELRYIIKDMKIPELYTYHGKRLELNEEVAEKARRVFMIGTTAIELTPVVIVQDEDRFEGIKMKFNNEQSTVMLTLNEMTSLEDNLRRIDIDSLALILYINYVNRPDRPKNFDQLMPAPKVDIVPKSQDFI